MSSVGRAESSRSVRACVRTAVRAGRAIVGERENNGKTVNVEVRSRCARGALVRVYVCVCECARARALCYMCEQRVEVRETVTNRGREGERDREDEREKVGSVSRARRIIVVGEEGARKSPSARASNLFVTAKR